jgi:hypothetical protein
MLFVDESYVGNTIRNGENNIPVDMLVVSNVSVVEARNGETHGVLVEKAKYKLYENKNTDFRQTKCGV